MKSTFFTIAKFGLTGVIGFFMLLNAQPWLRFADMVVPLVGKIPFLSALVSVPFLGGWIEFIVANLVAILGVCVWAILQFCQILPMLYDKEAVLGGLIERWQGGQYDSEKEKNLALKKLKEDFNSIPSEDVNGLQRYRMIAYIVEFIGCFALYLPYEGGFSALLNDAPAWDVDMIIWPQLVMIPVSMFGFELLAKLTIRIWRLSSHARPMQPRTFHV